MPILPLLQKNPRVYARYIRSVSNATSNSWAKMALDGLLPRRINGDLWMFSYEHFCVNSNASDREESPPGCFYPHQSTESNVHQVKSSLNAFIPISLQKATFIMLNLSRAKSILDAAFRDRWPCAILTRASASKHLIMPSRAGCSLGFAERVNIRPIKLAMNRWNSFRSTAKME
jgi:hypothetical protein